MLHAEPLQDPVATCARFSQTVPHAPQLFLSFVRFVSQPSERLLALQSPKPALQVPPSQDPLEQEAAMLAVLQAVAHPPQLATVLMFVSQPSSLPTPPGQLAKPALQVSTVFDAPQLPPPPEHVPLTAQHQRSPGDWKQDRLDALKQLSPVATKIPQQPDGTPVHGPSNPNEPPVGQVAFASSG